jgi:hypothetical protein
LQPQTVCRTCGERALQAHIELEHPFTKCRAVTAALQMLIQLDGYSLRIPSNQQSGSIADHAAPFGVGLPYS